jgi:hypothetical protein
MALYRPGRIKADTTKDGRWQSTELRIQKRHPLNSEFYILLSVIFARLCCQVDSLNEHVTQHSGLQIVTEMWIYGAPRRLAQLPEKHNTVPARNLVTGLTATCTGFALLLVRRWREVEGGHAVH